MERKYRWRRGLCGVLTATICFGLSTLSGSIVAPELRTNGQLSTTTLLFTAQEYQALQAREWTPAGEESVSSKLIQLGEDGHGGRYRDENGVEHINILNKADAALFEGEDVALHLVSYSREELRSYVQTALEICEGPLSVNISLCSQHNILEIHVEEDVTREKVSDLVWNSALKDMPVKFLFPGDTHYLGVAKSYTPALFL